MLAKARRPTRAHPAQGGSLTLSFPQHARTSKTLGAPLPPGQVVALQNPCVLAAGPLLLAAGSSDLLRALSGCELSRAPAGERLAALAGHVLGQRRCEPARKAAAAPAQQGTNQALRRMHAVGAPLRASAAGPCVATRPRPPRSLYPLYPAPLGACLDTSHYAHLQLPVAPDLLLLPSDVAPCAKVLVPEAWAAGAPPGLLEVGGCAAASTAPVAVVNCGRTAKGATGGTFAHVMVVPGEAPLHERLRVEVKRV